VWKHRAPSQTAKQPPAKSEFIFEQTLSSDQFGLAKDLLDPSRVGRGERRLERSPVAKPMITSALVALVNQWLQVERNLSVRWAQGNRNHGRAVAQADDEFTSGGRDSGLDRVPSLTRRRTTRDVSVSAARLAINHNHPRLTQ